MSIYLIKMLDLCNFLISMILLFKFIKRFWLKKSSYSYLHHHQPLPEWLSPSTPSMPPVTAIRHRQANTTTNCPLQFQTNFTTTDETHHFFPLYPIKIPPSIKMNVLLRCLIHIIQAFKPTLIMSLENGSLQSQTQSHIYTRPNSQPRSPLCNKLMGKASSLALLTNSPN